MNPFTYNEAGYKAACEFIKESRISDVLYEDDLWYVWVELKNRTIQLDWLHTGAIQNRTKMAYIAIVNNFYHRMGGISLRNGVGIIDIVSMPWKSH